MRKTQLFRKPWVISIILFLPAFGVGQVTQEWVARFNGPGNSDDEARSVAIDAAGNVYVTGSSANSTSFFDVDYATIKYNSAGVQQWEARYNGPDNSTDVAIALAVDAAGNVYVTGRSGSQEFDFDYTTIKYNSAGVQQWVARYNGPGNGFDEARSLSVDASGNVYITGRSLGSGGVFDMDFTTIKYNSAGGQQWVARYNGPGNEADETNALAVDASGNLYVTGWSRGSLTNGDYATIKYDVNGNEQWVARYNGPGNSFDEARALALDADGNVYVTGGSGGSGTLSDYATIKYDANGIEQWVARFDGPASGGDAAFDLAVDGSGNTYVTGSISVENEENAIDLATIKYNAGGIGQWIATYNGPGNSFDRGINVVLDSSGNVYISGLSAGDGTGEDFATIKYNAAGIERWVARYNGPGNSEDGPGFFIGASTYHSISVDGAGNVYVTGSSTGIGSGYDYATIKYAQSFTVCGHNNDKVLICHKGKKTICISKTEVSDHISHDDVLGECQGGESASVNAERKLIFDRNNELPGHFRVSIVPNPAATATKLYFELPIDGHVFIKVYDVLGREIATLVNANRKAGNHSTEFNVSGLRKGLYYCRIIVKTKITAWVQTSKIGVVK